jgi:hypothetical protein
MDDCHTLSVSRIARDWPVDNQMVVIEVSPNHRGVTTRNAPSGNGGAEPPMGKVGFSDDKKTGRLLIEPMYDPRPLGVTLTREIAASTHEGIHEGTRPVSWGRMDNHPSSLVYYEHMLVFEYYLERDLLAEDWTAFGLGNFDPNGVTGERPIGRFFSSPIHGYPAGRDERRGAGA